MEMLKQLEIVESAAGVRVEGVVVFEPTVAAGERIPPQQPFSVAVGWDTEIEGLWALYRVLSAEASVDLRAMRIDGLIEGAGSTAPFTVLRRRVVVEWSEGLPTPVLLLDFLSGDMTDDEVWVAYASLTVAVGPHAWQNLRQNVMDAITRFDV